MFAGKKSAQIREILISESAWEEMTCLFAPSLVLLSCFSIVIMVISKKEVRCVLLTRRYWYYSEKVSKTLQQCF
ncbi:TPA: hypothetical protein HH138_004054 [Escherichia coli]|nr:hypothetical protein [Escherichia coli]HAH5449509.1 hypothetical protein [Escherichia coli]